MMKYNAYLQKLRENTCIRLLIAVNKMSKTLETSIRCNVYIAFSKLSVGSFFFCPGPGLDNLRVGAVVGCCAALLRFILFFFWNNSIRHVLMFF